MPEDVLEQVDRAAHERHESRSHYLTRILRLVGRARRDAEITRRLDELFADPSVVRRQRRTAIELDEAGTDWTDERWCSRAARRGLFDHFGGAFFQRMSSTVEGVTRESGPGRRTL